MGFIFNPTNCILEICNPTSVEWSFAIAETFDDGTKLNFHRLDSLYYEPIVQQYIIEQTKTESLPYLGLDYNFFIDCYYRVKQIPLEIELRHFIDANPQFKREN